jgi:hypothetical protein
MSNIVLVLRSGGDFELRDVELIARHINAKWKNGRPRIICLFDKATRHYDLGNFELIPLGNEYRGTWARIQLYSPEMEQYRPFLYIDLDTAVISSLENIFNLIKNENQFIALEDFWQKKTLATPLVWFPANSDIVRKAYDSFTGVRGNRMDVYLRSVINTLIFWQSLTDTIIDFKPNRKQLLQEVPANANIVCFHGRPRIHDADIQWVKDYVNFDPKPKITVIIPYKYDRGWLKDAIASVPKWVQVIVSQGEGNWPENFNKVLNQATGDYIRWLHEDDMLTENCIEDSVRAIEEQGVDFIHGNAIELKQNTGRMTNWRSPDKDVTLDRLLKTNPIHSATLMYKRYVFDIVGRLDETLNTAEEYEFNLRCLKQGMKLGYCDSYLAIYRRHNTQKVRVVSKAEKDREREMVRKMHV